MRSRRFAFALLLAFTTFTPGCIWWRPCGHHCCYFSPEAAGQQIASPGALASAAPH
ncbi:MAG TPA: hypothetical protein VK395_04375 [Gemmataceae bacterium]|nr:hypothetical protein [Gemmataceae bacterium]